MHALKKVQTKVLNKNEVILHFAKIHCHYYRYSVSTCTRTRARNHRRNPLSVHNKAWSSELTKTTYHNPGSSTNVAIEVAILFHNRVLNHVSHLDALLKE